MCAVWLLGCDFCGSNYCRTGWHKVRFSSLSFMSPCIILLIFLRSLLPTYLVTLLSLSFQIIVLSPSSPLPSPRLPHLSPSSKIQIQTLIKIHKYPSPYPPPTLIINKHRDRRRHQCRDVLPVLHRLQVTLIHSFIPTFLSLIVSISPRF